MKRRKLLTGLFGLAPLSGCLSRANEAQLGRVAIANFTTTPISFEIAIENGDSTIYERTHELAANDPNEDVVPSVSIERELPEKPGTYRIEYGINGESTDVFDVSEHVESDCGQVLLDVRENVKIEVFVSDDCDTLTLA